VTAADRSAAARRRRDRVHGRAHWNPIRWTPAARFPATRVRRHGDALACARRRPPRETEIERSCTPQPSQPGSFRSRSSSQSSQVPGDLLHAVEPPARLYRVMVAPDVVSTSRARTVSVAVRALAAAACAAAAAAAGIVAVVVGGSRRRSAQSHPDHRPPPGVDYPLDGRQRRRSQCPGDI